MTKYVYDQSEGSAEMRALADRSRNQYLTIEENHIFSPTVLSVFRAGYNRRARFETALTKDQGWAKQFGIPVVVAVNRFKDDTPAELELIRSKAKEAGAEDAVTTNHWAEGGLGAVDLANAVVAACKKPSNFQFLYPLEASIKEKIETIVKKVYRGAAVEFSPEAEAQIERYTKQGFGNLPICIAKTQYSFSHDANLKGAPEGFTVPVREIRASVGAGFLFPLLGTMSTMPGLSTRPGYFDIDLDVETGRIIGLS